MQAISERISKSNWEQIDDQIGMYLYDLKHHDCWEIYHRKNWEVCCLNNHMLIEVIGLKKNIMYFEEF